MERIPNHFRVGLLRLVPAFWGKPRIAAFLQSFLDRVTELEDAAWDVLEARTIDNADTTRLEVLGRVVGQPRLGFADDETYRAVIRGKIRTSRSRALTDDIIEVVRLITQTTLPVRVEHFAPATMWTILTEPAPTTNELAALRYLLPQARGAGIRQHFLWAPAPDGGLWDEATWGSATVVPPIAFVGVTASATGTGAISVSWPAGHVAGDLGVLLLAHNSGSTIPLHATPSGWTLQGEIAVGPGGGTGGITLSVFTRPAVSGAEAAATTPSPGTSRWLGTIAVFRNVSQVEAINVVASADVSSSTLVPAPALPVVNSGRQAIAIWSSGSNNEITPGAGSSEIAEVFDNGSFAIRLAISHGAISPGTFGPVAAVGGSARSCAASIILAPRTLPVTPTHWSSERL